MSNPPAKRRRIELSLESKIKLIRESELLPKPTQKQLSDKFGVGKATVSDILKRKSEYLANFESNNNGQKFRFSHSTKNDELNELMFNWFRQAREKSIPLSGPILQEKSLEFASQLGITDFKASNGWLDKFKARHSIKAFKVSGESAGVDKQTVDDYRTRLPSICDGYSPCDIFNCDETGLYYRALPDKTLSEKGESSKGVKNSKERLTIMFACSATGEKLKPLVIGKSRKPRCFKNLTTHKLPVTWHHNKKAWMNNYIFTDWIKSVDKQMKRDNRKILMFLDNASSHAKDLKLDNVKLKFLPANTTSHLQPLDQGIIRAFKARYRRKMLKSLVTEIDKVGSVTELCKNLTVLDAIYWIKQAWTETRQDTIMKCFAMCGFPVESVNYEAAEDSDDDDDIPLGQLLRITRQTDIDRETLATFDESIPTEDNSENWEKNLVDDYINKKSDDTVSNSDSDDEETETATCATELSLTDIVNFSNQLRNFALAKDDRFLDIAQDLQSLSKNIIVKEFCKKKQSILDSFFVKKS